ncbi:MAG: hypothetical protein ABUM51_09675 [Bacteroidota bacterium]
MSSSIHQKMKSIFIAAAISSIAFQGLAQKAPAKTATSGNTSTAATAEYFTVEDYYRVKWGSADEFISLWKANHYPLLKKAQEKGDVISIKAESPRLHAGEDTRWDFRVTVVFRTAALAFDENLTAPYKKELYPDQAAFVKAEQHRFEILLSHWDVEVAGIPLD